MTDSTAEKLAETLGSTSLTATNDQTTTSPQTNTASVVAAAHPASLPITLSRSYTVHSMPTDAWVQIFCDRIVLGVSQLQGVVGNFLLCDAQPSQAHPGSASVVDYNVTTLLGTRQDPLLDVYARQVCEKIHALDSDAPTVIILGISLHKERGKDPQVFRAIVDLLVNLYQDARSSAALSK